MCQIFFDEESIYEISKLYLFEFFNGHMDGWTKGRTDKPKAICPFNFSKVGGIKSLDVAYKCSKCEVLPHKDPFATDIKEWLDGVK